jgi:hypothetical protein
MISITLQGPSEVDSMSVRMQAMPRPGDLIQVDDRENKYRVVNIVWKATTQTNPVHAQHNVGVYLTVELV